MRKLSIIIPVYNNKETLLKLYNKIKVSLKKNFNYSIVFIDDASNDGSTTLLKKIKFKNTRVKVILNKNNIGQEKSIIKGIKLTNSKYYFIMSADLQDDPKLIVQFYNEIKKNKNKIILFCKNKVVGNLYRKFFAYIHWKIVSLITFGGYPKFGFDVFGFTEPVKKKLINPMDDTDSILHKLAFSQFETKKIYYDKKDRKNQKEKSEQNFGKLLDFHLAAIYSISSSSLKFIWFCTVILIFLFFVYSTYIFLDFLLEKNTIYTGWRSLMLLNLMCFALIFIFFGNINYKLQKIIAQIELRKIK